MVEQKQGVEIRVESKDLTRVLNILGNMADRSRNIRPMLKKIGHIVVAGVTENFEQGGRPKWRSRKDLTNMARGGIATDNYFSNNKRGQQLLYNSLFGGQKKSIGAFERTRGIKFSMRPPTGSY